MQHFTLTPSLPLFSICILNMYEIFGLLLEEIRDCFIMKQSSVMTAGYIYSTQFNDIVQRSSSSSVFRMG